MCRFTAIVAIFLFCIADIFAQNDRLRNLDIKEITDGKTRTTVGLGSPGSYILIIYTSISDLEIDVKSAYDKDPIQDLKYETENKRFIIALNPKPLDDNRKYTLVLRHPNYHTNDTYQMTVDSFINKQLVLEVDGGLTKEQLQSIWNEKVNERANRIVSHYLDSLKEIANYDEVRIKDQVSDKLLIDNVIGISAGYLSRQYKDGSGTYPWCYIGDKTKSISSSGFLGLHWIPEFRYGIGLKIGCNIDFSYCRSDDKISLSDYNLSVPIRIHYQYRFENDISISAFMGPCIDIGIAYMINVHGIVDDRINLYKSGTIRRFNLLCGAGIGFQWNCIQLTFFSDWGITGINALDKEGKLNIPFGISLSYCWNIND